MNEEKTTAQQKLASARAAKQAKRAGRRRAILAVSAIAVALAAGYVGGSVYFMSHFYPGTRVNGANASGSDITTVKDRILAEASGYDLTIREADDKTESIAQADVDLTIDVGGGEIEQILNAQTGWGWVGAVFSPKEYNSTHIVSYNEKKLDRVISSLDCMSASGTTETEDAKAVLKDGRFIIEDEVYGTTIDSAVFEEKVKESLVTLADTLDLTEDKCYVQPQVTADSADLQSLVSQMNKVMDMNIAYTVGSTTETVSAELLSTWIKSDDGRTMTFDDEAIEEFVSSMASKYNTFGQAKTLVTATGATVTVPGGSYGWQIDKEGELAKLKEELAAGKRENRDFVYKYTAASHDGNDYGSSYAEVNLTAQHVYLVINGSVVFDTPCVTGLPDGHQTPPGAFGVTYCERNATLRGPGYETPVSYWMPFNGDIGFHDATWQPGFGGELYLINGSHGCVNLPLSSAQTLFGYLEAGFPVLCYDLPGSETQSTLTPEQNAQLVVKVINKIGEVSENSLYKVAMARSWYEALPDDATKALVTNLPTLIAAENTLIEMGLLEGTVTDPSGDPQAQIQNAIDKINAITDADSYNAAVNAYNALTEEERAAVTNRSRLFEAQEVYVGQ